MCRRLASLAAVSLLTLFSGAMFLPLSGSARAVSQTERVLPRSNQPVASALPTVRDIYEADHAGEFSPMVRNFPSRVLRAEYRERQRRCDRSGDIQGHRPFRRRPAAATHRAVLRPENALGAR